MNPRIAPNHLSTNSPAAPHAEVPSPSPPRSERGDLPGDLPPRPTRTGGGNAMLNPRRIILGAAALATAAAVSPRRSDAFSGTDLVKSPADRGVPAAPIPFAPPDVMLAHAQQTRGSATGPLEEIMERIIGPNGMLDATRLSHEMARSSPESIFEAINHASWCGGRAATTLESLRACMSEARSSHVPPLLQDPSTAQAEAVNVARLAFQQTLEPLLEHIIQPSNQIAGQFSPKPMAFGRPQEFAGRAEAVTWKDPSMKEVHRKGTMLSPDLATSSKELAVVSHHELVHAHASLDYEKWIASDLRNRAKLNEALTECLSTHMWTQDAEDSGYEIDDDSDAVSRSFLTCAARSESLPAGSFDAGLQILQLAYLGGDAEMLGKLTDALQRCGLPRSYSTRPKIRPSVQIAAVGLIAFVGEAAIRAAFPRPRTAAGAREPELNPADVPLPPSPVESIEDRILEARPRRLMRVGEGLVFDHVEGPLPSIGQLLGEPPDVASRRPPTE